MNFDFHQQYQSSSNIELLKIIRLKSDYQPDAISAAEEILSTREISAEETAVVDAYFADLALTRQLKEQQTAAMKNQTKELFQPMLNPKGTIHPASWVRIFLFIIAFQYIRTLYYTGMRLYYLTACSYCYLDVKDYFNFLMLLYIPVIFWLILKRTRWGWILLFADSLVSLILIIASVYTFFRYQSVHEGSTSGFLFSIFINAALVTFLWRRSIAEYFNVSNRTKINTAAISGAATILFLAILMMVNWNF